MRIKQTDKVLCICQYGHSRSVALVRVLHGRGIHAVAAGAGTAGDAISVLSEWADHVCVLQPHFAASVPAEHEKKVLVFDVGPDRWCNPYNHELLAILGRMVDEHMEGAE